MRIVLAAILSVLVLSACGASEEATDASESPTASVETQHAEDGASTQGTETSSDSSNPADPEAENADQEEGDGVGAEGSARLEGVPEDFPAQVPVPSGVMTIFSAASSGSGADKAWSVSFGTSSTQWKQPCTGYADELLKSGYRAELSSNNGSYVSATLVNSDMAVSMSCESGRMVILVGPAI